MVNQVQSRKKSRTGRQRRGQRNRQGGASKGGVVEALRLVNLGPGSDFIFLVSDALTEIPPRRVFRIQSLHFECAAVNVVVATPAAGPLVASAAIAEMRLYATDSANHLVSTSGPRVVGASPRIITQFQPTSTDWNGFNTTATAPLASIENICTGNDTIGISARIFGILRIKIALMPEDLVTACPTVYCGTLIKEGDTLESKFKEFTLVEKITK